MEKTLVNISDELEASKSKYEKLAIDFDKFMVDYDTMREKFDRLQIICDDHVEEIEKKAIAMSKMQMRMICQMVELDRITRGGNIIP